MKDTVIPIVFPDYLIAVNTPRVVVDVPDFLPFIDILPDSVRIPGSKNRLPELGHAGVLIINGTSGRTKYFEYGRYDKASLGLTRRVPIPDVNTTSSQGFQLSLARVFKEISVKAGQRGRIRGAYVEVPGKFNAMLDAANKRIKLNRDPNREPYDTVFNSCLHFMKDILEAGGVETPLLIDPRPNSYIEEIREDHRDLDFDPATGKLVIGQ